jgi:hypothetical protein
MKELNLVKRYKKILDSFIQNLKDIYQEGLVSIILYGSAASGEFIGVNSNINLLVVLNDTSLSNLDRVSALLNKRKFQIINPLFFSEDYIRGSLDVFPIEFLDMQENYAVLHGKDCLAGLEVDTKNLRYQCEQELKAKLLNVKNLYLRNKDKYALRNLLFKSFTSIMHILRNLVRLKDKKPAYLKEGILSETKEVFNIDVSNFKRILEVKNRNLKLSYKELKLLLLALVDDLEKIVNLVDKL